ncbi:zona pellucida sperm-binding protein 3 [Octodon degus]|uniref:Zona pellucida sperm-binding protein 3 n=1 Tax=Octodon degus TaxID=10160 RepID=A0A6P3ERN6_OCTDE|nr:zona pellucida sperm-binding protein 3 [Octodon degus]
MELKPGLLLCLFLLGNTKLCCSQSLWPLQGGTRPPVPFLPPIHVQCLEAQLVVTVNRDLFGTGKLVQPGDLTLGPEGCRPLDSSAMDDTVVKFEVGVHECGSSVQVTNDALVYSTFLLHTPRPVGNLSIVRTNRAEVPIECRYPRHGNVSSQAILPTWVPFRTTVSSEEKLAFSLRLMEENWSMEKTSPTFYLGEAAYLQAEVHTGSHPPLQLFVDYCVATPTPDQDAFPRHTIVDFHGCLVDGQYDSSSTFQAPRPRPDMLRFTVDVFHFANDSRNTIYITCHLKVTPAGQVPDQLNKACSFNKSSNSWSPVEGAADICKCCDEGNCGGPGYPKRQPLSQRLETLPLPRNRRHVTEEADVTVGPLIFLGEAGDHSVEGWASSAHTSMALGLGLAMMALLSLAVVLGLTRRCHTASRSVSLSQ